MALLPKEIFKAYDIRPMGGLAGIAGRRQPFYRHLADLRAPERGAQAHVAHAAALPLRGA